MSTAGPGRDGGRSRRMVDLTSAETDPDVATAGSRAPTGQGSCLSSFRLVTLSTSRIEHIYDDFEPGRHRSPSTGTATYWPHPAMRSEQVNARWVKSSFSFANGNCVEVAELPGDTVGIRDSRDLGGPVLRFTRAEWAAFLSRAGRPSGWSRRPDARSSSA